MKLKYQMRGLGVGIIVTALLMGVATGKGIPLSDAEIKAKALELGMVESDSIRLTDLTNVSPETKESGENGPDGAGGSGDAAGADGMDVSDDLSASSEAEVPSETDVPSEAAGSPEDTQGTGGSGDSAGEGVSSDASEAEAETGTENAAESGTASGQEASAGADTGDAVTVVIEFGMTSSHISEVLEEAGLVEDAAGFDSYLCNNGYSRSITAGTYEIVPGTSEEEIVKIITKTR